MKEYLTTNVDYMSLRIYRDRSLKTDSSCSLHQYIVDSSMTCSLTAIATTVVGDVTMGCISVIKCLPSMQLTLGFTPITANSNNKKKG
jgi:hypothetical protein